MPSTSSSSHLAPGAAAEQASSLTGAQQQRAPAAWPGQPGLEAGEAGHGPCGSSLHHWSGAAASVAIHALLLVGFALWTYSERGGGLPGEEVRIATLPSVALEDSAVELDAKPAEIQPTAELELLEVAPVTVADAGELELLDVLSPAGMSGQGALELGGGAPDGMASKASFMGVQARGERFCIIADCSGSMRSGGKIEHVKEEVLLTVAGLTGPARFQLYFFNNRELAFPQPGWRRPVVEIAAVRRFVSGIRAGGGTNPAPALREAFALQPRPDAVFFMTDGQFDPHVVDLVASLNASGKRVVVHTIAFMDRSAETQMKAIAEASGGKYRYVAGF